MQGLGILSSCSSGVVMSGPAVTAACDFGRKFSNSVSGSQAFVRLDPEIAFSHGSLKFSSILAPAPQWRCTYSKRSRNVGARAAGNYNESSKPIAPLQLESPTGQFLSQLLKDHPHLLPAAVDQQLERLVADRDAATQQEPPSSTSTELVLYRRIAEEGKGWGSLSQKSHQSSLNQSLVTLASTDKRFRLRWTPTGP